MEIHIIPLEDKYMIYRPLRRMAFLGNRAMADYVTARAAGNPPPQNEAADTFLDSIQFWESDLTPPTAWTPGQEHLPTKAVLMMTGACNLSCTYCYARGGEEPKLWLPLPMALATIDAAYENARKVGAPSFGLTFHGAGEPTLHWKVMTDAIKHARSKDLPCQVSMSTNGIWSEEKKEYILHHFDGVSLSFDGVREVQDSQRPKAGGGGSFEAVVRTLHTLDEAGMDYGVRLTVMERTFDRLPDSIRFLCEETNCQGMQVEPAYIEKRGEYADPTLEQAEKFAEVFMEAYRIARAAGRSLMYSGARPGTLLADFCGAHEDALIVTPEGDLVNCFEAHDRRHSKIDDFTIGTVKSPNKLIQIEVNLDKVRNFARGLEDLRETCQQCFCFRTCAGDCTSRRLQSPEATRRRCHANRTITREMMAVGIQEGGGVWNG